MTVECPSCASSFPVDPDKVPEAGVRARCSNCGDIFRVERPAEPEAAIPEMPPLEAPFAEAAQDGTTEDWVFQSEEPAAVEPEPMEPIATEAPTETFMEGGFGEAAVEEAPAEPEPEAEPETVQAFTFGKRDPTDKAKRLARVLVSDMIMYNAERHEQALANGTLKEDFEDEIEKSWKEYVEQVGEEMAESHPAFWTEALNELLAKGEQIF